MNYPTVIKILKNKQMIAFVVSIILIVLAFIFQNTSQVVGNILFGFSFIIGGYYKAKEGIVDFFEKRVFNVDLLMIIAAIGSSIIGYWEEGAILIVIFSFSGALEEFATARSTLALESLLKLVPEAAHKVSGNQTEDVLVETLKIGDCLMVRPGERIPVDGIILEGESSIDQSTITGESMPVFAKKNTTVFTGTLNLTQVIIVKNTTKKENTAVERVVKLIEEAETKQSKQEQFVAKFERIYVQVVLISSILVFLVFFFILKLSLSIAFYRTMIFLVVASPCAVVAATIPATLSAISNGARRGILFKGGESVEKVSDIDFLAFDKTGTITKGTPTVTNIFFQDDRADLKVVAMMLESKSSHPLAQAITEYMKDCGIEAKIIAGVEDVPGFGVMATIESNIYKMGSQHFVGNNMNSEIEKSKDQWLSEAKTLVYMSENDYVVGIVALQDEIRENAKQTISEIKALGISPMMLTGDNEKTAAYMTILAGIDQYQASCLPETKVEVIQQAKTSGKYTAMVGDGMNDGPAIAVAEVGIAMGGGSDLASGTADVVLMKNDLSKIPYAYRLSQKHNRIIRQNIIFALLVIGTLVISNLVYGIELPFAVVFHEGSTILVILNGLRLLRAIK
ncbi:MAG: heavy metal translocating P-type ATPase [Culicoidibacterales bacterium]